MKKYLIALKTINTISNKFLFRIGALKLQVL